MERRNGSLSPALQAAQARLRQLQSASRAKRLNGNTAVSQQTAIVKNTARQEVPPIHDILQKLPPHLGWGSTAVSAYVRASYNKKEASRPLEESTYQPKTTQPVIQPTARHNDFIVLHPTLAVQMLKKRMAASGRLWLLLKFLDTAGKGWHTIQDARQRLTDKDSRWRICGKRQFRNLLKAGEGVFWVRNNGRIWLRSTTKAAAALGVDRLYGTPVALPVHILTEPIGTVRAHLYASFHSGRQRETAVGHQSAPIARETISALTNIHPRIQRIYEKRAGVRKRHNIALGPTVAQADPHEIAWEHGRAARKWRDQKGQHGTAGKQYWAWQLPNNYFGPHSKCPRRAKKRVNRQLTGLSNTGTTGNSHVTFDRRFFANGRLAAKASHHAQHPIYWPAPKNPLQSLWYSFQIREGK